MEAVSQRTAAHAPQVAILFDKFHIMRHLGEALDKVRKSEYARLTDKDRPFIKGQKYDAGEFAPVESFRDILD